MTKIKLCGMKRECDIQWTNELLPEYIGFVFARKSKRYVSFRQAKELKDMLNKQITCVGVFVDEDIENIKYLVDATIIDVVQLHGNEDNEYIKLLKNKVDCPIIQAFCIKGVDDIKKAEKSLADYVMLDSGGGTGKTFEHSLIGENIKREYFLAGGLDKDNICDIITKCEPYAVDVSSALETGGVKDKEKMKAFVNVVRYGKDNKND